MKMIRVKIWLIIALLIFLSTSVVSGAAACEQENAAVQYCLTDNNLHVLINVIMAGERAFDPCTEETEDTYAFLVKQGMEMLSGTVAGVNGGEFSLKIEVVEESTKKFTKSEINDILAQTDDTKKNYIVVFPQASFAELKRDYPAAYAKDMVKKPVLGYESYDYAGSGYVVIMAGEAGRVANTAAHEAMHLLGVGDIGFDSIDASLAGRFDIMRYGNKRSADVSNIHIYMMLKANKSKKTSQWKDMNDELLKFSKKNGLNYSKPL